MEISRKNTHIQYNKHVQKPDENVCVNQSIGESVNLTGEPISKFISINLIPIHLQHFVIIVSVHTVKIRESINTREIKFYCIKISSKMKFFSIATPMFLFYQTLVSLLPRSSSPTLHTRLTKLGQLPDLVVVPAVQEDHAH